MFNSSQSGTQKQNKFLGAYRRNGTIVHWLQLCLHYSLLIAIEASQELKGEIIVF
jgi:hypothetical protein